MQNGAELEERDFFKDHFTAQELRTLIGETPVTDVFSWKSPSFKRLGLDPKDLDDDRLIALMVEEPRLIRRPITVIGGRLIVGADLDALTEALS